MKSLYLPAALLGCALIAIGCTPKIGRRCSNSLDCSLQGSRICDRTQPGGYCTIAGCEEGTCPSEGVCVKFRPNQERLAVTYCMTKCDNSGDCRDGEGYRCVGEATFGSKGDAKILGKSSQKFCALRVLPAQRHASFGPPDAAAEDATMSVPHDDAATTDAAATADAAVPDAAQLDAAPPDAALPDAAQP